jgi:hypothetical protein
MKKTLKIIGGIFIAMTIIGNVGKAIVDSPLYERNSIAAQIERANRDCPIPAANGVGKVTAIKLEGHNVTYYLEYKDGYFNYDVYSAHPEAARELFYLSFVCLNAQGDQSKSLRDEIIRQDYGFKVIITDGTGRRFVSELPASYLKVMDKKMTSNPSEALREGLSLKIQLEANGLPVQIDDGLAITNIYLEGNNIVGDISADEDLYDIDAFRSNMGAIAVSFMNAANEGDPESGALLDLCKVAHTGLIYRIIGNQSKQNVDVVLSSEFIREHRNIPSQVNIN